MAVTGKARIDYRDFAFLGQESTDAAVAARCADREGLFWRYHDLLFASQSGENQGAFARDRLLGLATFAGVADTAAFTACLDDPAVARQVAAETEEGRSYGIDSTPTIRIIGPGPTQLLNGVTDPAEDRGGRRQGIDAGAHFEPGLILEYRAQGRAPARIRARSRARRRRSGGRPARARHPRWQPDPVAAGSRA